MSEKKYFIEKMIGEGFSKSAAEALWREEIRKRDYCRRVKEMDSPSCGNWNRSPFSFGSNSGTP